MRCIISSYFSNILIITTFLYIIIIFFYFSNMFIIITFIFVMNIFIIIILKKTASRDLLLPRRVESTPLSGSSTQHMWELLAGTSWQFSHGIRGVGVSGVTLICVTANTTRQTQSKGHTYTKPRLASTSCMRTAISPGWW